MLSIHTVDVPRVKERFVPFMQGQGRLDDEWLVAARLVRFRGRAKAFAQAAQEADERRVQSGFKPRPSTTVRPDLHIFGRPWFVPIDGAEAISGVIDRFQAATVKGLDALCVEMLSRLELRKEDCIESVERQCAEQPKSDRAVANQLRQPLDEFHEAAANYFGAPRKTAARRAEFEDVLLEKFGDAALKFISWFSPAWTSTDDRVWPTELFAAVKQHLPRVFETVDHLFEPLVLEFPSLSQTWSRSLGDTNRIGGFVRPGNVAQLYEMLLRERAQILGWAAKRSWPRAEAELLLLKIEEAAYYAMHHNLGFLEARGVFDPTYGSWN